MREIENYKLNSTSNVDSDKNLQVLGEKINSDEIILQEIEKDYKINQKKYKKEYMQSKINYLHNCYIYYWLILKQYFDLIFFSEMKNLSDFSKEDMKQKGWMFPLEFSNRSIIISGQIQLTAEEWYICEFDKHFEELFNFNIGEVNSRIDRYYKQAIINYKNKCYYSCAVSLFPIIESFHQTLTNFNENKFYKIKENLNKVENKIEGVIQIYTIKIKYYIDLVKQFNDLAKNHYFKNSVDRKNEPEIINRNRIMHGVFSREINQKDCLQLFCVISNMNNIKTIIRTNDIMNNILKEIKELKDNKMNGND